MNPNITVKGIGRVSAPPDRVVLSLGLEALDKQYETAMETAADNIDRLTAALTEAGFEKDALKTANFTVRTDYTGVQREDGRYEQVFNGYAVRHDLKVTFDLDPRRLSAALAAIGGCLAHPDLSVTFTVKDPTAIGEEMLRSAAENARQKALVLCAASGVTLGDLVAIHYNWEELNIVSNTRYALAEDCLAAPMMAKSISICPEDIDLTDTATFVWKIKGGN